MSTCRLDRVGADDPDELAGPRHGGYRRNVRAFDLDMAFEPAALAAGLEQLLDKLGHAWSCVRNAPTDYELTVTLSSGGHARLMVRPLPPERMTYVGLFPRTLLEVQADDRSDIDALRSAILLAFLRVTG
jgi:hypothetical protein